jgi:phospholipase C
MIPLIRPATHPVCHRLAMLFLTLLCAWITAAQAATVITVTSVDDSGVGTLRAALASAADGDTIDASGASGTILLTNGELRVTRNVTIRGPGPDALTVDGNSASRVFHVNSNVVVRIANLTIANGYATRRQRIYRRAPFGGGIYSDHASLTISNCTLSGNYAGNGGAVYVDGGTLTIDTSTLSDNNADNGGAVYVNGGVLASHNSTLSDNSASKFGGGIYNQGNGSATQSIDTSTLSGNKALFGGAFYVNGGTLTIDTSTLSDNSAGNFGGGIYNRGGANGSATIRIHNSTLSGNSAKADHGGGIYNLGSSSQRRSNGSATLQILNSTLSGNSSSNALHGGGIYISGCSEGCATLEIGSTILHTGISGRNIFSSGGTVTSDGYNLCSDDGSGFLTAASDLLRTEPLLGPLEDNGGPTFTHALFGGSPAIDAGANLSATTTDQRGAGFARSIDQPSALDGIGSDHTDIGAFEVQPVVIEPTRIMTNIEHVVVLMLENRSLDNVLGWLYGVGEKPARVVPDGSSASFNGVAGKNLFNEYQLNTFTKLYTLPVRNGVDSLRAPVFDPYEEYVHVNVQLFADRSGNMPDPISSGTKANMKGFAYDFDATYETTAQLNEVMGAYTPQQLPVLNGLARSYGVSDRWFSSVPTQTDPNRAFSLCGTSLGRTENEDSGTAHLEHFNIKTIWNALPLGVSWGIYYCKPWQFPLINNPGKCWTELTFPQIDVAKTAANNYRANSAVISPIASFLAHARAGTLPDFSYLEPAWGFGKGSSFTQGNDYHPPTWVGPGEDFVNRVYEALIANSNAWSKTLLIITFDEHGGTYDHVDPGWGAVRPDTLTGGDPVFQFNRYGVRVPTILVSPWIPAGTVFRAPADSPHPFDHTSLIATILKWKGVDPAAAGLRKRVAVAPTFESALGDEPRSDVPRFTLPAGYADQDGGAGVDY